MLSDILTGARMATSHVGLTRRLMRRSLGTRLMIIFIDLLASTIPRNPFFASLEKVSLHSQF